MIHAAGALYNWLRSHDIDPDKVRVVLQTDDEITADRIGRAVVDDVGQFTGAKPTPPFRRGKLHGLALSIEPVPLRELLGLMGAE